ncbi:hypothetical protein DBV15_07984 [Temnothorax longispinosus]|uniref:Uncharacterized protein n=1 Tax=Temnothorax longispinosus TaxID=300112 RepID=A0A4V3SAG4_9HYME|nr:hypothetical protein DBV15_07984 [Temnothorax longispinosus]
MTKKKKVNETMTGETREPVTTKNPYQGRRNRGGAYFRTLAKMKKMTQGIGTTHHLGEQAPGPSTYTVSQGETNARWRARETRTTNDGEESWNVSWQHPMRNQDDGLMGTETWQQSPMTPTTRQCGDGPGDRKGKQGETPRNANECKVVSKFRTSRHSCAKLTGSMQPFA